ncbi:uncharacterized protein K460DRAFT_410625 [Cucurbitaria berberidis CBS 394.84]|uniref:Uncharacterized protein n=1 Tax=Cucurbitaria berberidis CBS 394.84 TaxID=1168544 RepID=A0A9P4L3R7_9PLEO|nr:uncharacterized protein K460DRAFT_410625 [Cucurbitaria berberidis CBS 394.84]KAF1841236.1 hypothetical protein K460DRAFT_410625 [Cucurbitaria berberidis CBS 394.84]
MRLFLVLASFVAFALAQGRGSPEWRNTRPGQPTPDRKCIKYWGLCHGDWDTCNQENASPGGGQSNNYSAVVDYATSAKGCNPFACLEVLVVSRCITKGIANRDTDAVSSCSADVCDCLECIPGLDAFDRRYGVCN